MTLLQFHDKINQLINEGHGDKAVVKYQDEFGFDDVITDFVVREFKVPEDWIINESYAIYYDLEGKQVIVVR
jgi:hypothetical protein